MDQQCLGVYPLNCIPKIEKLPACLIINLDRDDQPGSHWVAVYIDGDGNSEYFDSFGRPPEKKEIKKLLIGDTVYNGIQLQSPFSSACGQYCVYFLFHRVRGDRNVLSEFSSGDYELNDETVVKWINKCFNVDTDVFEVDFVVNQVARMLFE